MITILPLSILGQTDTKAQKDQDDITKWTNKTIMWVGPHQDDESGCLGTLSLLKANGEKIYERFRRLSESLSF
jgi:hypothetical protein